MQRNKCSSSRIRRIEDILAWQRARCVANEIHRLTSCASFGKEFGLRNQLRRASVSVMSNIAEGFERRRRGESKRYSPFTFSWMYGGTSSSWMV